MNATSVRKMAVVGVVLFVATSGVAMGMSHITILDDFEDNDIAEYSGATDAFTTTGTNPIEGDYSLKAVGSSCSNNCAITNSISDNHPNEFSVYFQPNSIGGDGDADLMRVGLSSADLSVDDNKPRAFVTDSGDLYVGNPPGALLSTAPAGTDTGVDVKAGTEYRIYFDRINWTAGEMDVEIYDTNETLLGQVDNVALNDDHTDLVLHWGFDGDNDYQVDYAGIGNAVVAPEYNISGEVTDEESRDDINGATVEVYNGNGDLMANDTTNQIGDYEVGGLIDGNYTMWVNKSGYKNENRTIEINGSDIEGEDFKLTNFNDSIELSVRDWMDYGESYPYEVVVEVDGDRSNVTAESTVTSSNTTVVSVDSNSLELLSTSDISVNKRVTITAEYVDADGNTYTTTRNVTVANKTVKNMGILPTGSRLAASLGSDSMQVIIVATMIGVAAAVIATSFGGLAAMAIIVTLGWFAGMVGDGMLIVTITTAVFIGLNMAGNIDYQVRQS